MGTLFDEIVIFLNSYLLNTCIIIFKFTFNKELYKYFQVIFNKNYHINNLFSLRVPFLLYFS